MENTKRGKKVIVMFVMLIMLSSFVVAFGVNYPGDVQQRQLNLFLGDEKELTFFVQLASGEGNTVNVEIKKGFEILTLTSPSTLSVPTRTLTEVNFDLKVPSDARIGDTYPVEIAFTSAGSGTGTVVIGNRITAIFDAEIVERPRLVEEKSSTALVLILLAIGVVILALIIYFLVRRKK